MPTRADPVAKKAMDNPTADKRAKAFIAMRAMS
jgi:hypothetical protein